MSVSARWAIGPALLVLVLLLAACGGSQQQPRSDESGSPALSARPVDASWSTEKRTLDTGRTYWIGLPRCGASPACTAWKDQPRKLVIWLHAAMEAEAAVNATAVVDALATATRDDAIVIFAVSADGSRRWDADTCCTDGRVDEIGYLEDVIADAGTVAEVRADRVGLLGVSNGGMLAAKAICAKPDVFRVAAVWAATWKGRCDRGPVTVGHWHGTADQVVPIGGGTRSILGRDVRFAPADWMRGRLPKGSTYTFVEVPGAPHVPVPAPVANEMLAWFDRHL